VSMRDRERDSEPEREHWANENKLNSNNFLTAEYLRV
jgi:hypothetical protein